MAATGKPPILCLPVIYDVPNRKSPMFHRDIEALSVDLIAAYVGKPNHPSHDRVGHSLNRVSFFVTGLDQHLRTIEAEMARILREAQKPPGYVHVPPEKPERYAVTGRQTYPVFVAANSFFYFGRSLLDELVQLMSCTLRVPGGSMNDVALKPKFRKQLERHGIEAVADLVDAEWRAWGLRFKDYRDLLGHHDALAHTMVELVEDPGTGQVLGVRLYLPATPKGRGPGPGGEYVEVTGYFHETRVRVGEFLEKLLSLLTTHRRL